MVTMTVGKGAGSCQLILAVKAQKLKKVIQCATADNVDQVDQKGRTPLHYASALNTTEYVDVLLKAKASVNVADAEGYTALHLAAGYGRAKNIRALLDHGADPNATDHLGRTSYNLAEAVGARCSGKLRPLIEDVLLQLRAGAERCSRPAEAQAEARGKQLVAAAHRGDLPDLHRALAGPAPLPRQASQEALAGAARLGHEEVLRALLAAGVDANTKDGDEASALLLAADLGSAACVRALLEAGADIEAPDRVGVTPLVAAAYNRHAPCVEVLLAAGACPVARSQGGVGPLVAAAEGGCAQCLKALVQAGADIHTRTNEGNTAMMHAAGADSRVEALKFLIKAGSDVTAVNTEGRTALHYAAAAGATNCAIVLVEAGADLRRRCKKGRTALEVAGSGGHTQVERVLAREWAALEARAESQQTDLLAQLLDEEPRAPKPKAKKKKAKKSREGCKGGADGGREEAGPKGAAEAPGAGSEEESALPPLHARPDSDAESSSSQDKTTSGSEKEDEREEGRARALPPKAEEGGPGEGPEEVSEPECSSPVEDDDDDDSWQVSVNRRSHKQRSSSSAGGSSNKRKLRQAAAAPPPSQPRSPAPAPASAAPLPPPPAPSPPPRAPVSTPMVSSLWQERHATHAPASEPPTPAKWSAAPPAAAPFTLGQQQGRELLGLVQGGRAAGPERPAGPPPGFRSHSALDPDPSPMQELVWEQRRVIAAMQARITVMEGQLAAAQRREGSMRADLARAEAVAEQHAEAALAAVDEAEALRRHCSVWMPSHLRSVTAADPLPTTEEPSWCKVGCCEGDACKIAGRCLSLAEERWQGAAEELARPAARFSPSPPSPPVTPRPPAAAAAAAAAALHEPRCARPALPAAPCDCCPNSIPDMAACLPPELGEEIGGVDGLPAWCDQDNLEHANDPDGGLACAMAGRCLFQEPPPPPPPSRTSLGNAALASSRLFILGDRPTAGVGPPPPAAWPGLAAALGAAEEEGLLEGDDIVEEGEGEEGPLEEDALEADELAFAEAVGGEWSLEELSQRSATGAQIAGLMR